MKKTKQQRMDKILSSQTGKTVIVPIDHGVTDGPLQGLENLKDIMIQICAGGANAIVGHVGTLRIYNTLTEQERGNTGFIAHLSGSTALDPIAPQSKVLVNTVENAVRMGADAVSIQVNIGDNNTSGMMEQMGRVVVDAETLGIPVLAMMYPRGPKITEPKSVEMVKFAARVGAELGADIVKTYFTGDPETMKEVVRTCPVPVVIAGGGTFSTEETLQMVSNAMSSGVAGLSMGRTIFGNSDPEGVLREAVKIVHG